MDRDNVSQWLPIVQRVSRETGVPVDVIFALIDMESSGNPRAKSSAGALGLGQVMPFHFRKGEDPYDPYTNLSVGIGRVFKPALDRYGTLEQAAAAYFGAIDGKGNITGAKDATGTDGHAYVRKFSGLRKQYAGSAGPTEAEVSGAVFPVVGKSAADIRYGYGDADYKRQTGNDHKGVDTYVPIGTQVVAPVSGRVVSAGYDGKNLGVVIEGPDGKHYSVWHLSKTQVKPGQQVQAGQPIALSGDTDANAPHVHFQIRAKGGGAHEDPSAFLASTGGGGKIGRARPMMTGGLGPPDAYGEPRGPRDAATPTSGTYEPEEQGTSGGINYYYDQMVGLYGQPTQVERVSKSTTTKKKAGGLAGESGTTTEAPDPEPVYRYTWDTPTGPVAMEMQSRQDGSHVATTFTAISSHLKAVRKEEAATSGPDEFETWWARDEAGGPEYQYRRNKRTGEVEQVEGAGGTRYPSKAPADPKTAVPKYEWEWVPDPENPGTEIRVGYDPATKESIVMPGPDGQPIRRPVKGAQTDAQGNVINTDPDEPFIVTQNPDGSISQEINPNYQAQLEQQGYEVRQGEDGGWWAIDPGTGDAYPIDTGQAPVAPPNYTYREDPATGQIMAIDPATNSAIPVSGMGTPLPPQMQLIQNHLDTIAQIEGMLGREEITYEDAERFIAQANQYAQAAQYGATPFQQEQERRRAEEFDRNQGENLINQRLSTGSSLASSLTSSAFNLASTTMMPEGMSSIGYDPAALAIQLVNEFGGGPEVTEFAKMLLMGSGATPEAQAAGAPTGASAPSTPGTITPEQYQQYASRSGTQPSAGVGSLLSVQPSTQPVGANNDLGPKMVKAATGPPPGTPPAAPTPGQGGVITPEQFAEYQRRLQQRKAA